MVYSAVKYKKFDSQRRFGVELETSNTLTKAKVRNVIKNFSDHSSFVTKYQLSGESASWHIKDDATCGPLGRQGPKGVEVASFVAKGIVDLQHIADVAQELHRAGCRVNDNCGLHIHAEAKDLTEQDVGVILAHWLKIEPVLAMSLPVGRNANVYCRRMMDGRPNEVKFLDYDRWTPIRLYHVLKPKNLSYYENDDRRVNLNLVNYTRAIAYETNHRKTLELRWPEGTLDPRDIKCWVRLFLGFIDTCKTRPMPANLRPADLYETLTYLGLNHTPSTFIIFSEGLHDTKTWFLERILEYGSKPINMVLQGHPVLALPADTVKQAKYVLNEMWSPMKKYA
jgi:hypothetical protein